MKSLEECGRIWLYQTYAHSDVLEFRRFRDRCFMFHYKSEAFAPDIQRFAGGASESPVLG